VAYTLYGVVGNGGVLGGLRHPTMHPMQALGFGYGLCRVRTQVAMDEPLADLPHPLPRLTESVLGYVEVVSVQTPVIYVAAEEGEQSAAGWYDGEIALGPLRTAGEAPRRRLFGRTEAGAINAALRWLGVPSRRGSDRFAAVGLGLLQEP
jgi:hypothetical protein